MAKIGCRRVLWARPSSGAASAEMAGDERGATSPTDPRDGAERPDEGPGARRESLCRSLRIRQTPNGPVRLSPTEVQILGFIGRHEGYACSKAQIAAALGRNEKVVGRLLSRLRKNGLVTVEPVFAETGAQMANIYRLSDGHAR